MDISFDQKECSKAPEFNQDILDGLTYKQMKNVRDWVDSYIRTAERSYPEGVEFVGSSICSPIEAYRHMASLKSKIDKSKVIDMAPNDVFMVKYQFRVDGTDLKPKYLFLPNFRKGNLIKIAGKEFNAMPVLTDPGFSVTSDYVFIRVQRAPVTFNRIVYTCIKDGETLNNYIAHSKLHWKGGANDRTRESDQIRVGGVHTSLAHYLFCKYGVVESFRRFADTEIKIIHQNDVTDELRKTHAVYTTRGVPPKALKYKLDYGTIASRLAILVPREKVNTLTEDMVTSMWYVIDHFPDIDDPQELFLDYQWKIWLGYILWGDQLGHPKLVENVDSHLKSLDDYIDAQIQQELLEEEDVYIEDFYHLFAHLMAKMNELITTHEHNVPSMFNKRLTVVPYVLKDIIEKIFKCMFELNNTRRRKYTIGEYERIFGRFFTVSAIMGLRSTSSKPFMASVSTPGDNMYYRFTSRLVMQAKTGENTRGSSNKVNVDDPANHIHHSWIEGGNYGILPHSFPLAKSTINPTAKLDERYTIVPKDNLKELRDHVQKKIES